jgi:hypothetical protein
VAIRAFLSGPGVSAIFDSPWAPIFLAISGRRFNCTSLAHSRNIAQHEGNFPNLIMCGNPMFSFRCRGELGVGRCYPAV